MCMGVARCRTLARPAEATDPQAHLTSLRTDRRHRRSFPRCKPPFTSSTGKSRCPAPMNNTFQSISIVFFARRYFQAWRCGEAKRILPRELAIRFETH
jgi:hypothetical protein